MDRMIELLEAGRSVILPTETVYGLFAKAFDQEAVDNVYALKQRPRAKAMNLNVASYQTILDYSKEQPPYLKKLCDAFLPGPLTIILKANDKVPDWINSGYETVGFRMPNHSKTLEIIKQTGPLIGPSANLSGEDSGQIFQDIRATFDYQIEGLADDSAISGLDSTIIDISKESMSVLRQGAITVEDLLQVVPELLGDHVGKKGE